METHVGTRGILDVESVQRHFDATARSFDAIYSSPTVADRVFRRDMYERFRRTLAACHPVAGKSVLDIGCGSGQYTIALANRGAGQVVGLDFAVNMLKIAAERARRAGVEDRCRFVSGEFVTHEFARSFEYILAVGVFDYIEDPRPLLEKARALTRSRFIATFPRRLTWRAPVRKLRLRLKGCPVFFYTRHQVVDLMTRAGFDVERAEVCGKIYWVSGTPSS
jgi:2-polyprenyl-3-methyl-5-hydroxy-6-metoxy-1,4-benzoquinol methylase